MSTLEQLLNNFDERNRRVKQEMEYMRNESRNLIQLGAKELLSACSHIKNFFWVQYTPNFNDGEPCTFSVHDVYFTLVDAEEDSDEGSYLYSEEDLEAARSKTKMTKLYYKNKTEYEELYRARFPYARYINKPYLSIKECEEEEAKIEAQLNKYTKEERELINTTVDAFASYITKIPEEAMQYVFGDGVKVIVSEHDITIEDFYHD